ncbi:hypothetical protein EJ07DRAFT_179681 [Lizonia empirigonia]|nr:hypothetical protein EJ07DRAFT_179681 [Lizonia empirigonia]
MTSNHTTPVDEIAEDNEKLQEKVKELTGEELTIDSEDTVGADFKEVGHDIRAVLVRKKSGRGAFRVTGGNAVQNVETGPDKNGAVIVLIKPGQIGMCLGKPSFRCFKRL